MEKVCCVNFDEFDKTKHWFKGSIYNSEILRELFKNYNKLDLGFEMDDVIYYYDPFLMRFNLKSFPSDVNYIELNKNVAEFKFEFKEIAVFDRDRHYVVGFELAKKVGLVSGCTWEGGSVIYYLNRLRSTDANCIPLLEKAGYTEYKEY